MVMSKTVKSRLIKVASLLLVWGLAGYGLKMLNKSPQTTTAIESSAQGVSKKTNGGVVHVDGLNATIEK